MLVRQHTFWSLLLFCPMLASANDQTAARDPVPMEFVVVGGFLGKLEGFTDRRGSDLDKPVPPASLCSGPSTTPCFLSLGGAAGVA